MATLLVIGGTGFFGKSILDCYKRKLLNNWKIDKVIIFSRSSREFEKNNSDLISKNVELIAGDISTIKELPRADFVIYAAASADSLKYSFSDEMSNLAINGVINYCKIATILHKNSKIIFCSSGAVYGYQPPNLKGFKEDMDLEVYPAELKNKKNYALCKRESEFLFNQLAKKNLNISIARCFSFNGTYLPLNKNYAIASFISCGLKGQSINIEAKGLTYRSYMHSDDLVKWLLTIAENSNSTCPIYNVGSDYEIEIRELANIIAKKFNTNVNQCSIINNTIIDRYIPSVDKARNELKLDFEYSFKDTIFNITK
ncbi:NAD(P)-dependent oxidoreductase [Candidatus Thioglobus sp.]|nr:NAD(P)-dependent oxidoreductase [Candidatus Thioglobus sp.]